MPFSSQGDITKSKGSYPNYNNAVAINSFPYTTPSDGFILIHCDLEDVQGINTFKINGFDLTHNDPSGRVIYNSNHRKISTQIFPVAKGSKVEIAHSHITFLYIAFIPAI